MNRCPLCGDPTGHAVMGGRSSPMCPHQPIGPPPTSWTKRDKMVGREVLPGEEPPELLLIQRDVARDEATKLRAENAALRGRLEAVVIAAFDLLFVLEGNGVSGEIVPNAMLELRKAIAAAKEP